jgi:choline-sulfatase
LNLERGTLNVEPGTLPNIILICSDQHRHDWLGCAGARQVETPHLDNLAARGVRFTDAYCNAPLCGPSRMSFLTGRHPYRNRVFINEHTLSSDVPTIAHALGRAGYETVLCGRMHFMGLDQRHGFQRRLVGDICRCYGGGPAVDYGELTGSASNSLKAVTLAGAGDSPVLQYDEDVTLAFERLAAERAAAETNAPLFCTVGWYGPHHPFTAPRELYEKAVARLRAAGDTPLPRYPEPRHPWLQDWMDWQKVNPTDEQIFEVRANYAAMIDLMDQRIGRLLRAARQLPGDTLVVYISDHGEMAGDRALFGKCTFHEASVKVPFIIAPLGGTADAIAAGTTVNAAVSLLDLAPTLAALVDAPPFPLTDGDDLGPLLAAPDAAGEANWQQRPVMSELEMLRRPPIRMIRKGPHKLVYYHEYERPMLFDLAKDPDEQNDLGTDPVCATVRDALLREVLADWDPEQVITDVTRAMDDLDYQAAWGRDVGMGPLEVWDPQNPVYEFAATGVPMERLDVRRKT